MNLENSEFNAFKILHSILNPPFVMSSSVSIDMMVRLSGSRPAKL